LKSLQALSCEQVLTNDRIKVYILAYQSLITLKEPDMKKIYNLIPWLVALLLVLWIILTESPFRKGGVGEIYWKCIAGFVLLISILIAIRYTKAHLVERLIVAGVFAALSLLLMGTYVMPPIINSLYYDRTWHLWETKPRIIINAIYYGLITADLVLSFWLYFKFNTTAQKRKKQSPPIPS
jgi:hypothetical protein